MSESPLLGEFHELGIGAPHPISAAHGQGIRSLLEAALEGYAPDEEIFGDGPSQDHPIRLAVAGRPNVGKSTLINAWLGEERLVAFDMPGTTRDAIHIPFEREGRKFELIDTAGLRRKGKVFEAIEKFSVVKTLQAIADANVVLLLVDATQGVSEQDAHIAGYIQESGRAVVIAVNKWDATDDYQRQTLQRSIESRLSFLKYAPVLEISAIRRQGLSAVWKAIYKAHASATIKMTTPVLTRLVHEACRTPGASTQWPLPAQDALCPPGRHEPAAGRRSMARRWITSPTATSAFWKAGCAITSSWSARRSASRCARRSNPFDAKGG